MLPEQYEMKRNQRNNSSAGSLLHRLYDRGISNSSMPSLRHPLTQKKDNLLMVNLTSSQSNIHHSPKVIKKQNYVLSNTSKTAQQFYIRKTKQKAYDQSKNLFFQDEFKSGIESPSTFKNFGVTTANFFNSTSKVNHASSEMIFTKSDYLSKSPRKAQEILRTRLLMDKLSGKGKLQIKGLQEQTNINYEEKDQVFIQEIPLLENQKKDEITVENYINLVMKNVANIDQFLYVVRRDQLDKELQQLKKKKKVENKIQKSKSVSQQIEPKKLISFEDQNPYQLQIVQYQDIKQMDKQANFEYYTLSKKGFCHYYNGKPIEFIQLEEWINQKSIYEKIKKLKFFNRFRKWKMIKMWRKIVVKHYIQTCSMNLEEKLFFLNPSMRQCLFDIKKIGIDMGKSVLLIGKNDTNYSLESFKRVQQKIQGDTSRLIQQFSTQSRVCVKKCFQNNLFYLKQTLKNKSIPDQKHETSTHPNHKDNAFQALGFPAKMSYQHRSKLRKMTGKFVRFSYLVDLIHTTSLASIFQTQLQGFISRLQQLQAEQIKIVVNIQGGNKTPTEQQQIQKLFNLILQLQQKPIQKHSIQQRQFEPFNIEDPNQKNRYQLFSPVYHIKTIDQQSTISKYETQKRQFCPTLSEDWLFMHPTIDDVFQQLSRLIREGLDSLKFFQRWSKHREMQKYVNILQQWDDIVSDNWQIAENDNLDPQNIIENYDKSLNSLKKVFIESQKRISRQLKTILLEYLNKYWQNKRINLAALQSENLNNPSQTIQCLLGNMMYQLDDIDKNVPVKLEHGIFQINLSKVKRLLNQLPTQIFESLKGTLPSLTDQRLNLLNAWLTQNSTKLKEQIHNIDDFVRIVKCLNHISDEQKQKKDLCDDLKRICQTLQYFGIDKKKRKQFETITLKAKDSFDQQINYVQTSIQRKQQTFTMEVLKYHIPNLNKEVQKLFEYVQQGKFLKFCHTFEQNITELNKIQEKYQILAQKKIKCQQYRSVLKDVKQLDFSMIQQLKKQIQARVLLWQYLDKWQKLSRQYSPIIVKDLQIPFLQKTIKQSEIVIQNLQNTIFRSQVLSSLQDKVKVFQIHIPLIEGFNSNTLNESHWQQILQVIRQKTNLDVRKKEYTFKAFIESGIGKYAEQIKIIFHKSEVEYYLQNKYSAIQSKWLSLQMKSKIEGKFALICDFDHIFEAFEQMIPDMVEILKNPFAGKLKMYSITYQSLIFHSKLFANWIRTQDRLVRVDKISKILDAKKLPDYCMLETAEKNYKLISKIIISSRNNQQGLKLSKLFAPNTEDKLLEINQCLDKLENNFKDYLMQLRRNNPTLYFFNDEELIELVIDSTNLQKLESAILKLYSGIKKVQFEGQKIVSLTTIDDEKLYKIHINITGDIDQTFYQIAQTISQNTKKMLRNCRYRIVEFGITEISQLHYLTINHAKEPLNKSLISGKYPIQTTKHNIQFVLALNKADFSHYTHISIENLSINSESLKDFHHITLKDFQEDFPKRLVYTGKQLKNYELLIVQNGIHRDILNELISLNVQKTTDFAWLNQMKFVWDEQVSNNDEVNLLIRKLHLTIRYGNQLIGSETPILMNPDINLLSVIKFGQISFYNGTIYSIARLAAGLGKRVRTLDFVNVTCQNDIRYFIAGCYAMENYILFQNVQNLSQQILQNLNSSFIISTIHDLCMKKQQVNLQREININQPPIFLTAEKIDYSKLTVFRQKYRVVQLMKPKLKDIQSYLNLCSGIQQNYNEVIKKTFQLVEIIQPNSVSNRICVYEFLDNLIKIQNFSQLSQNVSILSNLFEYLKPKMNKQNFEVLQKHVRDMLTVLKQKVQAKKQTKRVSTTNIMIKKNFIPLESQYEQKKHQFQTIFASKQKKIIIFTGSPSFKTHLIYHTFQKTHQIYSINLHVVPDEELYGNQTKSGVIKELLQKDSKKVIHIQGINCKLLTYLSKYYHSGSDQLNLQDKNVIIIETEKLSQLTPASLLAFGLVNFEFTNQWGQQMAKLWANQNLSLNQKDKFILYFTEILQASLNLHSQLSHKQLQSKYTAFFMLMNSLLPISNILQATIYAATWVNQDIDDQYLKYQYFITKFAKQNLVPEGSTLYDMVYMNQPKTTEGLVLLKNYLEQLPTLCVGFNSSYIISEKLAHFDLIARRIYQKTNYGIYLSGPQNSGKTAFMNMLRYKSSINTACLSITLASPLEFSNFKKKLELVLQPVSIKAIGPRVNYNSAFILVDDINMEIRQNQTSIELIKSIIKTKKIYEKKNLLNVQNVNFILAGREYHSAFKSVSFNLHMDYERESLQVIFLKLLENSVGKQIKNVNYDKIIQDTYKIYEAIEQQNKQESFAVSAMKRIFLQFKNLKLKEYDQLQIVRFWVYQLYQKLSVYERADEIIQQYLINWNLPKNINSKMLYSHFHIKSAMDNSSTLDYVRDNKKIFNIINQRIQNYNSSENKRYGNSFQFINFDELISKIIKISNNIQDQDYFLYGRKGTGKTALIKIAAYLDGINFKFVKQSLKATVLELFDSITSVSSYMLCFRADEIKLCEKIVEFYESDFQMQLVYANVDKNKQFIKNAYAPIVSNISANKFLNKSFPNFNQNEHFIHPKVKYSAEQIEKIRKTFKIAIITKNKNIFTALPQHVAHNFMFDTMPQIPQECLIEYNAKLIQVDKVQCTQHARQVLFKIFNQSKADLGLSLKMNDDCVRLFSSLVASLIDEIKNEVGKYEKTLNLSNLMGELENNISNKLQQIHKQLRQISSKIKTLQLREKSNQSQKSYQQSGSISQRSLEQELQNLKNQKLTLEQTIQESSAIISKSQKISEIINSIVPHLKQKHSHISQYIQDRNYLEQCLAITACYFTFLSSASHEKRSYYLNKWYQNINILNMQKKLTSVLPLFNLYKEQFNADYRDELEDFYQNMAIIYNSIKPVIIDDACGRGRSWLENLCSFVTIDENDPNFNDQISKQLPKGTNIIIRISRQQVMNNLQNSFIETLLYLSESTPTVQINGKQVKVDNQTKVYLLLGNDIIVPAEIQNDFIIVRYEYSEQMIYLLLQHETLSLLHPQIFGSRKDLMQKIKKLKLQCAGIEVDLAQMLNQQFYPELQAQEQKSSMKSIDKCIAGQQIKDNNLLSKNLLAISDKKFIKMHNLSSKMVEKSSMILDLQEKLNNLNIQNPFSSYYKKACILKQTIDKILRYKGKSQLSWPYFIKVLSQGMKRGLIKCSETMVAFGIKFWGSQFDQNQYLYLCFLVIAQLDGSTEQQIKAFLATLQRNQGDIQQKQKFNILSQMNHIGKKLNLIKIGQLIKENFANFFENVKYQHLCLLCTNTKIPLLDLSQISGENFIVIRMIGTLSECKKSLNMEHIIEIKLHDIQLEIKRAMIQKMDLLLQGNTAAVLQVKTAYEKVNYKDPIKIYLYSNQQNLNNKSFNINYEWNVTNQIDFMKQLCNQKAQIDGIAYKTPLITSQKAIQTMIMNNQIDNSDEIIDEQGKVSYISNLIAILVDYITKHYQLQQIPTKFLNKNSLQALQNLQKYVEQEQSQKQIIFSQIVFKSLRDILNDDQFPIITNQINELTVNICSKIKKISAEGKDTEIIKFIQQIVKQEVQLNYNKKYKSKQTFSEMVQTQSQFLALNLTWLAELRSVLGIQQFNPGYLFANYDQILQLCSKTKIVIPVRKSRLQVKQIANPLYANKKKNNRNKNSCRVATQQSIHPSSNKELKLIHLLLQRELEQLEQSLQFILNSAKSLKVKINNKIPSSDFEAIFQLCHDVILIYYNTMPEKWKMSIKDMGTKSSQCMMLQLRQLSNKKRRIHSKLRDKIALSSLVLDLQVFKNPISCLQRYFLYEPNNKQPYYYLFGNGYENGLKIQMLYAVGWKTNNEGFGQNSEGKVNLLQSHSIVRKMSPIHGFFSFAELYLNKDSSERMGKIWVQTKKVIPTSIGKLYLQDPKSAA